MGSRDYRRAERQAEGAAAFFGELLAGVLAIPGLALGLLMIAAFFQVAAEEAEGVLWALLGFGIALAVTLVALLLVAWVATRLLGPASVGWLGIFSGRMPEEYGPGKKNLARALANLLLTAISVPLGIMLFRHGYQEGEINWAIEGLFLAASGVVLGLMAAIPRLYFARKTRLRPEKVESEQVIRFVVMACLGVGLSLAVSFGITENRAAADSQKLRPEVWNNGCVALESKRCPRELSLIADLPAPGRYMLQQRGSCRWRLKAESPEHYREVRWVELHRQGIEVYDKAKEIRTRVVELKQKQKLSIIFTRERKGSCYFKLRYRATEHVR